MLKIVDYAVVRYGTHEEDYCLTNCSEVDAFNLKVQTLVDSKTEFSVAFSKWAER